MQRVLSILRNRAVIYFLLAFFCLFLACLSTEYDFDLYARLIVGERFVGGLGVAFKDFLSYTPTHLWYDHEWGSGVVFYLFLKYFGPFGLILLHSITMFITAVFVIKTQKLQKHAYPVSILFMAVFLFLYSHQNPSIVRCHMFSFMFFAIFLYLLEKTRRKNSNILWLVPFITVVWNNLHGGIVSGLGIIFIYLVCEFFSGKSWRKYFYVLLVSVPLLVINPYGINYLTFLISANTKTRTFVTEWWNVLAYRHLRYYYPIFFTCLFGTGTVVYNIIKTRRIEWTKFIVLLVTVTLGILHVKLLSLPLIVIASLYYNEIIGIFNKKAVKILNIIIYILIFASIFRIHFLSPNTPRIKADKFPVVETEFVKINNLQGKIISEFEHGSYIAYKLYPKNLIYMDGRYEEVYYDWELDMLAAYELAEDNWYEILDKYPADILIPGKTIPVYKNLENSKKWVKVFEGPLCGVFVKKENAKIDYLLPSDNLKYYQDSHFDSNGKFGRIYD